MGIFAKISLFFGLLLFAPLYSFSQILQGSITDENGKPVANATIFIKELQLGTSADENGSFELKVPKGKYNIIFQSIGYTTKAERLSINEKGAILNVGMNTKAYEIPAVIISNNREDPAYRVMRHVIGMTPYYSNQIDSYTAEAYIKGSAKINKISRIIKAMARDELKQMQIKDGSLMLMESMNEIKFKAPDEYHHRVISTNTTLPSTFKSINTINFVAANVYKQNFVARDAFSNYRFAYEGFTEDGDLYIYKIKLTPRGKNPALVSGYIYVINDLWCIYSVDLKGTMQFGKFNIKANFNEVQSRVYLPSSYGINADLSVLGNKGEISYAVTMRYKNISINTALPNPLEKTKPAIKKEQPKVAAATPKKEATKRDSVKQRKRLAEVEKLITKDELTNREMLKLSELMKEEADSHKEKSLDLTNKHKYKVEIDSGARQYDSTFWSNIRPIPLKKDEVVSYQKADSVRAIEDGRDTTSTHRKAGIAGRIISSGNFYPQENTTIRYRGLLDLQDFSFNSVDGFKYGQHISLRKNFKDETQLNAAATAWWAFSRQAFMWKLRGSYSYYPERRAGLSVTVGQHDSDYNNYRMADTWSASALTLFLHKNYNKLYEQFYITLANNIDLANGLTLGVEASYYNRRRIENSTEFSIFRANNKYVANIPVNDIIGTGFTLATTTTANIWLSYTPEYYYRTRGRRKRMVKSDYPTFTIFYSKGFCSLFGSESDFDFGKITITQKKDLGIMKELNYKLEAVKFFNAKHVDFPDFYHFNLQGIAVYSNPWSSEYDRYYRHSTNHWGVTGQVRYTNPYILLKYIPRFSNTYCRENIALQYLYTPNAGSYTELHYSVSELFLFMDFGIFVGFNNLKYSMLGLTLSYKLQLELMR
ncbi:MAG: DUF5686 and carboxypeptidase regulatory-like domain-containing protein [Prevotellaceae bacterium]|jgi:hypothetical protein|nr:DUF5686 and carboxypeptidase regulatory-like domain-containing protein [Prevotellaceae bacterium]